ncbi:MAG: anti-sigma factor family protein [Polyangiaceae bacterium]
MHPHPDATRDCRDYARTLGSYLDGELEASQLIEIDGHVSMCERCREEIQLLRATRGSLRRVVRTAAPSGLGDRIGVAMMAERMREDAYAGSPFGGPVSSRASWRSMVPVATAAAIALVWGAATRAAPVATKEARAGFGDDLLAELVAEHSQPLPPDGTNPQAVRGLERYVGFPVHPASFERGGAHLVSGRVVPLHSQRAYMLQYLVGTGDDAQRVSVLVYDAEKIQVNQVNANLAPRSIGTAEVRVGREKGYSVAATQRAGVGYLLASDLDPDRSAALAAMVYDDR